MTRMKLTTAGKVVIFLLIIGLVGAGTFFAMKNGLVKSAKPTGATAAPAQTNNVPKTGSNKADTMDISLDEWIGWKPIVDANGGLTTQPGSIYDKLGLKVNINIINDATQSSNALIKGDLDGAGYTVNRLAFLYDKFVTNKVPVKMPYVVNSSTGGDGIIAKAGINRVEDLVSKKIGVPRYSEAQTLVWWLLSKSDLTQAQVADIQKKMVMFDTPDDAAKAFFAGQVDAAATWQPYLSQAQSTNGAKLLFSTKAANNIILDGVLFRNDYMTANADKVAKFTEGALKAADLYTTSFDPLKKTMPLFSTETNDSIKGMLGDATLSDYTTNKRLMNGTAQLLFQDMSSIWDKLGEKTYPQDADKIFDSSVMQALNGKFAVVADTGAKFTDTQRQQAQQQDNNKALLKKTATINFQPNSAQFLNNDEAFKVLNGFVDIAKILDGAIIQIEGNIASDTNDEAGKQLSLERAKAVANYLQLRGVDPSRFVILGNGGSKPVGDNKTEDGMKLNRRTDVLFKVIE